MDKSKVSFYRFEPLNILVTVVIPVCLTYSAAQIWYVVNDTVDILKYFIIFGLGLFTDFGYQYSKHRQSIQLVKEKKQSTFSKKMGLSLLLWLPLSAYLWTGYIIVSTDSTRVGEPTKSELEIQKLEKNLQNNHRKKVISPKQNEADKTDNQSAKHLLEAKHQTFVNDLSSDLHIYDQFRNHTMMVFQALDPRAKLSTEELAKTDALTKELTPLMKEKNWAAMIELNDKYADSMPELVEGLMQAAGMLGAPLDVYLQLANRGGKMAAPGLLAMVNRGELDMVSALESHGSSIQDTPFPNTNMLHFALLAPIEPQTFEYVIERVDVLNEPSIMGGDTIGMAIVNAPANPAYVSSYIQAMIRKGGTIKPEHKPLMAGLKRDEPSLYEEITALLPELQVADNG
ncbi:hypothetical protein D5018_15565 [Parashewanella curva]|uniref:Uncharacterized protein n=1 Tax=Parashewanella curva TaxID=2338552 RepID=A0A3L8PVZ9_9GAMM|nr:hypothetical protein [Parashewanella curva]RLV58763.1 hypothetical protein D5018_15565 [Parashewanella curva]